MKLVRYGQPGAERPGVLDAQGVLRDLSMLLPELGPAQLAPRTLSPWPWLWMAWNHSSASTGVRLVRPDFAASMPIPAAQSSATSNP